MGCSKRSRAANSSVPSLILPNFEFVGDFIVVLVTCKNKEEPIKNEEKLEWSQDFPHYNPMGAICCYGNQSSDPNWPKTKCNQSPIPIMPQMKLDYDLPVGRRDIHV